jgi:hypothetical protein
MHYVQNRKIVKTVHPIVHKAVHDWHGLGKSIDFLSKQILGLFYTYVPSSTFQSYPEEEHILPADIISDSYCLSHFIGTH